MKFALFCVYFNFIYVGRGEVLIFYPDLEYSINFIRCLFNYLAFFVFMINNSASLITFLKKLKYFYFKVINLTGLINYLVLVLYKPSISLIIFLLKHLKNCLFRFTYFS
jgi:hypothetical protein